MLHPILVIQHTTDPDTGWLAEAITQTGHVEHVVQPHRSEGLPPIEQLMAVVVLGGSQSAYEDDRHPYLAEEKQYLKRVDQAGVPILGICLGAQLLADALGGHVYRAPSSEVGYPQLHLTRAGRHDPVLRQLKGPVFVWHHDTFTVPPGADVLAKT
ncbi:MAG: type 1 glutamine amidotransferase, partial [Acidimicrobiia bacterium]